MRNSLLWKLMAINVAMIAVVLLIVWVAVDYLAADYFTVLMDDYGVKPADSHKMFVDAIHGYLLQAGLAALALAMLFSYLLIRTTLRPRDRFHFGGSDRPRCAGRQNHLV